MILVRKLSKWGGSLGVRIPRAVLRARGWKVGDELLVDVERDLVSLRRVDTVALAKGVAAALREHPVSLEQRRRWKSTR